MTKHVLIITSEIGDYGGGLAFTSKQLVNILEDLGCCVDIKLSINNEDYIAVDGGYDPHLGEKIRYTMHMQQICRQYQASPPDIIIAYGAGKNGFFAYVLSQKMRRPLYLVLCGSDINLAFWSSTMFLENALSLSHSEKVVALSNELLQNAQIYDNNITEGKYCVIPNAYNFNNIVEHKPLSDRLVFATSSTFLSEKKGIANLIQAFAIYIRHSHRNDVLRLYGKIDSDVLAEYRNIILDEKMQENIFICGYFEREKLFSEMKEVDIYIQLSPYEGCCNSIGEAIASKKYILISNTGYFAEVLKNKFPQMLINSTYPHEIAKSIEDYVEFIHSNDCRQDVIDFINDYVSFDSVRNLWKNIIFKSKQIKTNEIKHVVMFHDISVAYSGIDYPHFAFEKLVDLVYEKGYKFCSYDYYSNSSKKDNLIICTFDDAYKSVYNNAFPIMEKYGFSATVFVCPDLIGKSNKWNRRDDIVRFHMDKDMLKKLYQAKWEIGSHGMGHYNLLRLSQTELEFNLVHSKHLLTELFGEIRCFCYPYGEHKSYIRGLVSKFYDVAFAVDVGGNDWNRDRFQMTRIVPEELKKILEAQR